MSFEDEIKNFSKQIKTRKADIHNEETTKTAIILPFLKVMGYDTTNPSEVKAEYTTDVGTKKGEKVDLAILDENKKVNILIECKPVNTILETKHLSQLLRYYSVSEAEIGLLTNGIIYKFYGDSKQKGIMDQTPFLEINLLKPRKSEIDKLEQFTKEKFSIDNINESINELKYAHDVKEMLLTEINNPSDDLVRVLTKKVYDKTVTKKIIKQFKKIIKSELNIILQEKLDKTLQNAIENNEINTEENKENNNKEEQKTSKGINTTQEEIDGYNIIRSIASEIINPDLITMRDRQSYCGVLYNNNQNYAIVRLHFNNPEKLAIELFNTQKKAKNGSRVGDMYSIQTVNDIYNFKDEILNTIRIYKQNTK